VAAKDNARAILSYATPNPVGPYRLVTPPKPDLAVGKTKTPILPVVGGTLVNVPTPIMPTKQSTPVAPPLPSRLVNVPTQQGRVVNKSIEENAKIFGSSDDTNKIVRDGVGLFEKDKLYGDTYRERLADYYKRGYTGEGATSSAVIDMYQDIRSLGKSGIPKENIPDLVKIVRTNDLLLPNAGSQGPTNSLRKNFAQRKGNVSDTDLYKVIGSDLNSLDKAGRETYIALMPTWTGTHKELVDVARSLSK
jgi:hypothetical protein